MRCLGFYQKQHNVNLRYSDYVFFSPKLLYFTLKPFNQKNP